MLISALNSTRGETNPLNITAKRSICVILVDGLGAQNLKSAGAHASYLNSQSSEPAMCWFPATTATSITSFATASDPWTNGFLGYQVFNASTNSSMNLLSGWSSFEDGVGYQRMPTIAEQAKLGGIAFHTIAPASYEFSGFTGATMRGNSFQGVNSIEDRFTVAKKLLGEPESKIIYLYIPELDQIAHAQGSNSTAWLNQLELVDSQVRNLGSILQKSAGILLTADHGVVDVDINGHIYLDELIPGDEFRFVGGDTRSLFLYFKNRDDIAKYRKVLEENLGDSCYIVTTAELIAAGYWKTLSDSSLNVAPDLFVLARKKVALYHRAFAKKKSLQMVGHHGSITNEELSIPLIKIGF